LIKLWYVELRYSILVNNIRVSIQYRC